MTVYPAPGPGARPPWRQTTQTLLPVTRPTVPDGYDLYPAHALPGAQIGRGFGALTGALAGSGMVLLDGLQGVLWDCVRAGIEPALARHGQAPLWLDVGAALLGPAQMQAHVGPFLGGDDPLFGYRCPHALASFFDPAHLHRLAEQARAAGTAVVYGTGAALLRQQLPGALVAYLDLPRNELQFRQRAGSVGNLGERTRVTDPKAAYKRSYFVDWPVERRHQFQLLPDLDLLVDSQRPDDPTFIGGGAFRAALDQLARTPLRARPWFEPGPWGGQWIREKVPQLPQDVPNYAWSFELISPENGLLLESGGLLLEFGFDFLMQHAHHAVLGDAAARFGQEFPLRFDWLDTVQGGNLSLQVHPSPGYITQHFGEHFTQDETYYVLDAAPDAEVYLGFQVGVQPAEFRQALEASARGNTPMDVGRYVQSHPARAHDLFLIPHGTVHCSGAGTMVLEISATPYIFTFKLYDWLRLGLDGRPRPLNLERGFDNLNFSRQGAGVPAGLISRPELLTTGHTPEGHPWRHERLPTHPDHFYDIERLSFSGTLDLDTAGACHVLALVAGTALRAERLESAAQDGGALSPAPALELHFAETFVVPAATGRYRLTTPLGQQVTVLRAFVRPAPPAEQLSGDGVSGGGVSGDGLSEGGPSGNGVPGGGA